MSTENYILNEYILVYFNYSFIGKNNYEYLLFITLLNSITIKLIIYNLHFRNLLFFGSVGSIILTLG